MAIVPTNFAPLVAHGYTDAVGQALQIIGADQTVGVNSLKAVLTAELNAAKCRRAA